MNKTKPGVGDGFWKGFWPSMAILVVVLAFLFRDSFKTGYAHFSNDGPLGILMAKYMAMPDAAVGSWADLYWLGANGGTAPASLTYLLLWLLGPIGFAKFYPPITLFLLGASAWIFFRTLRLAPGLCLLGGLAASLNMNFFSNTCWGLGTRSLTLMSAFLALALLNTRRVGNPWVNAVLAGFCVGLGIVEGADNGAIFSLFVGAYVVFQSMSGEGSLARRLVGVTRLALVGICAALLAAQVLVSLTGIAARTAKPAATSSANPEELRAAEDGRWVFATQWSLPPQEMLRVIIPGIYGYRMDTPDGGEYWGRVGEYWAIPDSPQRRASRSSGAGEYAGVLVVLIGLWAVFHAWRPGSGPKVIFEAGERRHVLFWAALLVPAVVLAWGYHAPFYKLVYSLPYFSTIRNPMKFMHPGHMILIILFGYGLLGLHRRYLAVADAGAGSFGERFRVWSSRALPVERWWFRVCCGLVAISAVAFVVRAGSRSTLVQHLQKIGFPEVSQATAIAKFSTGEVGWFVLFLVASAAIVTLIQIGAFAGARARWAVAMLGLLLTLDMCRANAPWIRHYDYREQYASNPVIDVLRQEPWQHRVTVFPYEMMANQQLGIMNQIWRGPWLQWLAPFYNIQSIDIPQDPRPPAEKTNYMARVARGTRLWELTNTRYILGLAGPMVDALNQQLDPAQKRFRVHTAFTLTQGNNNYGAQTNATGPWALIEFTGALPRAGLYTSWQASTNDDAILDTLAAPTFNPRQTVLVHGTLASSSATNSAVAPVDFVAYAPTQVELKATAATQSVLLLNDLYDRDWSVTVDGQPATLLRCNYLMRGVQVPPGAHTVVFRFQPSLTGMKITLGAFAFGLVLCGLLFVIKPRASEAQITNP